MEEIAEAHPLNFSCPIVEGVKAERYEVDAQRKKQVGFPMTLV